MEVRIAGTADAAEVLRLVNGLIVELGGGALDLERSGAAYRELLARPELGFAALGEVGGRAVAVCTVSFVHALRSLGRYAIVQEMYVEPEQRSSGIGQRVLERALARMAEHGCRLVELGTPQHGRPIPFYRRCGFVSVGERLRRALP